MIGNDHATIATYINSIITKQLPTDITLPHTYLKPNSINARVWRFGCML